MVLAIFNMVLEPPRRSRATPFGTPYKHCVSDASSIDHNTPRVLLTTIPYNGLDAGSPEQVVKLGNGRIKTLRGKIDGSVNSTSLEPQNQS